ncbi:MAG: RNA polymerase sigma factor [Candidatus Liptonbacteria bacterium]|nr:RNA polymerase sigma factor [Candidatus Liptonbacteria bacterium]
MEEHDYLAEKDEKLVALALENAGVYRFLVARYEQRLFRYIMTIAKITRADAEDILQTVFLKAYQNLNDFDPDLKFSSWIYRIAHNETISHLRRFRWHRTRNTELDETLAETLRSDSDIEQELSQKYRAAAVRLALQGLDGKYREVLVLRYLEDRDYREISDILKKPVGTVATLLSRAKRQLREKVAGEKFFTDVTHG